MFFSKIYIKPTFELFKVLSNINESSYAAHKLLWNLFKEDKDIKRDFIFRQEYKNRIPYFYMVSKRQPEKNKYCNIESKNYDPKINEGGNLFFNIRINPVITKKREGKKNSTKHDIWMNSKLEGKKKGIKGKELCDYINDKVKYWFIEKSLHYGFELSKSHLQINRYFQNRIIKRNRRILYSSIDYSGILKVINFDKFKNTLFNGIGRSKAFGCGLLLIKRI